ncbi:MAG: AraC family transcriptional regulator [Bryobacteraceae bacterium]|nr:AraC family transcriptional regulator [Bryobacteraceae bacterium]
MRVDKQREAQFSVHFIRSVVYYAVGRGADLAELCRMAEFPQERLSMPDDLVSGAAVEKVWEVAIELTGDPDLGLHTGESLQPAALGLLGFAMLSSATLGAALDKMARYWNLMSDATSLRSSRTNETAVLQLVVLDLPGNFLMWNRQPVDSSLSAAVGLARALTGRPLALSDVASTFPPPPAASEYERIFRRRPRFHAEANQIAFPAEALGWPVIHSNPAMLDASEEQIRLRLAANFSSVCDRVRAELAKTLRGEIPDLKTVAKSLGMSERALQRDLQMEGASFSQVRDELRRDLALGYLRDSRHSITDIAFLLGFSEASVLHRYFRRWTGITPQEYRRTSAGSGAAANHTPA